MRDATKQLAIVLAFALTIFPLALRAQDARTIQVATNSPVDAKAFLPGTRWEGTWRARTSSGPIKVHFGQQALSHVKFIVEDRGQTHRWRSAIAFAGSDEIRLTAYGFNRVDTYTLSASSGGYSLKGSYTYKGEPWGTVRLNQVK